MSLNITVVTWNYVACITDRRVTRADGVVLSERSNKLTCFNLENGGRGFVTYNGVGCDKDGITPSDWLANLPLKQGMSIGDFAHLTKAEAEPRLRAVAPQFDNNPRHTFVIGAYQGATPILGMISNYESFKHGPLKEAEPELTIELMSLNKLASKGAFVITGADPVVKAGDQTALKKLLDKQANAKDMIARATKVVKDVSYRKGRRATVGTSTLAGIYPQFGEAETFSTVVGGALIADGCNFITPSMRYSNMYFSTVPTARQAAMSRGEDVSGWPDFLEPPCPKCKTPVPEGYLQCPVCDEPTMTADGGTK